MKYKTDNLFWKPEYDTGIQRIDLEHRIFLELITSLSKAIDKGYNKEMVIPHLYEIEKYAEFHFLSEENFMKQIKYPSYESHKKMHLGLLENFNLVHHESKSINDFFDFICDWFFNHTIIIDKKIMTFINENNIDLDFSFHI